MVEMKTIKELREKHKKEIQAFQANCKHEVVGDWVEEFLADDVLAMYSTGFQVRRCKNCEKVIQRRSLARDIKEMKQQLIDLKLLGEFTSDSELTIEDAEKLGREVSEVMGEKVDRIVADPETRQYYKR